MMGMCVQINLTHIFYFEKVPASEIGFGRQQSMQSR